MTTQTTTAPNAAARKAANKEFTRRGQLLTRIAQGLAAQGTGGSWYSGLNDAPVFDVQCAGYVQCGGYIRRGYLIGLTRGELHLKCLHFDDMEYGYRLGELTTACLERLAKLLEKGLPKGA